MMKKFTVIMVCMLAMAGVVSAQGRERGNREPRPRAAAETVTVTGTLTIVQGMIAVNSGGDVYVVPGLMRYAGFIDALKDGARVTIEGTVFEGRARRGAGEDDARSGSKALIASKMTIGGKDYDLAFPRMNTQDRPRQQPGINHFHHYLPPPPPGRQPVQPFAPRHRLNTTR